MAGLKSFGGKILKPFQNKRRGEREHEFYEQVFRTESAKPIYERLRPLIPGCHGMVVVPIGDDHAASEGTGSESRDGSKCVCVAGCMFKLLLTHELDRIAVLVCNGRALGDGRPDLRTAVAVHHGRQSGHALVRTRRERREDRVREAEVPTARARGPPHSGHQSVSTSEPAVRGIRQALWTPSAITRGPRARLWQVLLDIRERQAQDHCAAQSGTSMYYIPSCLYVSDYNPHVSMRSYSSYRASSSSKTGSTSSRSLSSSPARSCSSTTAQSTRLPYTLMTRRHWREL